MEEKFILECQLGLGFKRSDESAQVLFELTLQTAALVGFEGSAALDQLFESIREPFARLVAARAIDRIEIRFGEDMVRLNLRFDNSPTEQDEIDLSLLEFVPPQPKALELWFFAQDPQYAQYVGAGEIEKHTTQQVPIHFSALEPEDSHSSNEPPGPLPEIAINGNSLGGSNRPNGFEK